MVLLVFRLDEIVAQFDCHLCFKILLFDYLFCNIVSEIVLIVCIARRLASIALALFVIIHVAKEPFAVLHPTLPF